MAALSPAARALLTHPDLLEMLEHSLDATITPAVVAPPDACGPGLPASAITVADARQVLRDIATPFPVRDIIWRTLVRRARDEPEPWEFAALWVMLPGLRAMAYRLHRTWHVDLQDIRSEVVTGFIQTLRQVEPERPKLGAYLRWTTFRRARDMCRSGTRETVTEDVELVAARRPNVDVAGPTELVISGSCEQLDQLTVEGRRLGSVASRLGLRGIVTRSGDDTGAAA